MTTKKQKRIQQDIMSPDQLRQLYIIRQSQMERSLEFFKMRGIKPTLLELALTAEHLTHFVLHGIESDFVQASNRMEVHFNEEREIEIKEPNV